MDFFEQDGDAIIGRFREQEYREKQEEVRDKQLTKAANLVERLYSLEHKPLSVPNDRHKEIAHFWQDAAQEIGGETGDAVEQLGKALGFVYELQSDPEYTIGDRLSFASSLRREKRNDNAADPLTENFIRDFTLARLSTKGGLRNAEQARDVYKDTRAKLTETSSRFADVAKSALNLTPYYFPKPVAAGRSF